MTQAEFEVRLLVALLWMCTCTLARSPVERKICAVGTIIMLAMLWAGA